LRHPRSFFQAIFYSALHFLTLLAAIASGVLFLISPHDATMRLLLGSVAAAIVTWIFAYFRRRVALCPLCKGTPLLNSGALPHHSASRIRPFNFGISAVLSCLFTHHFRCMYCGSRYDLLRQPRDHREADDDDDSAPRPRPRVDDDY
jgi:hypothetical protein